MLTARVERTPARGVASQSATQRPLFSCARARQNALLGSFARGRTRLARGGLFAILEQIDRPNTAALGPIWARLSDFLEIHAEAEERHFYPTLLKVGTGAGGRPSADAETEHAIKDHNEIRQAVAQVAKHAVGSEAWYAAVAEANKANSEHMGEEEREGLADFRDNADLQTRHDLAVAFATFEAVHYQGVRAVDKDPKAFVEAHK